MDQRDVGLGAQARQDRGTVAIGAIGGLGIAFRRIHRGIGGGVDHQTRGDGAERGLDRLRAVEVEVRAADAADPRHAPPGRRQVGRSRR